MHNEVKLLLKLLQYILSVFVLTSVSSLNLGKNKQIWNVLPNSFAYVAIA